MIIILKHIKKSISGGMLARLEMKDGVPGVLFLDEHEFIAFDDLNYNGDMGYFQISLFPDAARECKNAPVSGRNIHRGTVGRRWAVNEQRVVSYIPPEWVNELIRLGKSQSDAVRAAIDVTLHPFESVDMNPIRLADSLPCGIRTADGHCEKPAYAAHVYKWRHPVYGGNYVLLPVCEECARVAAESYHATD